MTLGASIAFALGPHVEGLTLPPSPNWPADPPNVYVVRGRSAWAMVDAGWGRPEDLDAIDSWLAARPPLGRAGPLLLTHAHHDHIGGASALAARHGLCPTALGSERQTARRHGLDDRFTAAADGDLVDLGGVRLRLLATPGHTPGSASFHLACDGPNGPDVLFSGDTVVGRHSAWIGPPDGDLDVYLETLARLAAPDAPWAGARLAPGHGPAGAPVGDSAASLRRRRLARDRDILALLAGGPRDAHALAAALYGAGAGPILGPGGVAERTVFAHLAHLERLGRVVAAAAPSDAEPLRLPYRLVECRA